MPEDMRLRIGPLVANVDLVGTPAILADTLLDFFEEVELPLDGTDTEKMVRLLQYFQKHVLLKARARRRKKKDAANAAAASTQVDQEISF